MSRRRRASPASPNPLLLLVFLLLHACAAANLMGVDLGLGYIKVAIARHGRGLELVTNEQAKRKTPAAVGFTVEGERLFGDAAIAYAAKAPHRAILTGRSLIGQCAMSDTSNPGPFCPRYRLDLDGIAHFSGEEVVAMLLAMARRQASTFIGGATIKDVAITVPSWYDERQRIAVADAARVIGLNCLGVVNANTAAAIKYALDGKARPTEAQVDAHKEKDKKKRTPKSLSQRVMFFDIGAGSASASIAEITTDIKTGIASNIKMLSHASDQSVAGHLLDDVIVERLATAFDEQRSSDKSATPARDVPRVMTRLRKEAQKVREVLSANTETYVSVGSLHDDVDLRTTLTRSDFENDAQSLFARVSAPAKAALSYADLAASDLDAVVPFGGVSRTPRVQEELCNALGIPSLNKSINSDEAAVIGAAFFAASLSSTFRVRKMDVEDRYDRSVSVEIDREASGGLFSGSGRKAFQTVEVIPEGGSKIPMKKTVSLNRNSDVTMRIFLNMDKAGKVRFPERTLYAKVNIKGVAEVLKKLKDQKKAKSTTPRVAISFHIDRSGLIRIGTAESSVDETVVVEREVEIKEDDKKNDTKKEKNASEGKESTDSDKPGEEDGNSKDETPTESAEGDSSEGSEKTDEKKKTKKTKIEKSTQTVVHRHSLSIEFVEGEGLYGMQMSGDELEKAKKVLKDLETADKERVELADALNALEGYILEVRSLVRGLDEDEELYKVSSEDEREKLVLTFDEAEEWMYGSEAKQVGNLRKKHFELKKMYGPMERRAAELTKRPKLVSDFKEAVNASIEHVASLREAHVNAKSEHVAELDKASEVCVSALKWLDEKVAEQDGIDLTEEPVLTESSVKEKGMEVADAVRKVLKLEIPVKETVEDGVKVEGESESESEDAGRQEGTDENVNSTESDGLEAEDKIEDGEEAASAKADAGSDVGGKDEL